MVRCEPSLMRASSTMVSIAANGIRQMGDPVALSGRAGLPPTRGCATPSRPCAWLARQSILPDLSRIGRISKTVCARQTGRVPLSRPVAGRTAATPRTLCNSSPGDADVGRTFRPGGSRGACQRRSGYSLRSRSDARSYRAVRAVGRSWQRAGFGRSDWRDRRNRSNRMSPARG